MLLLNKLLSRKGQNGKINEKRHDKKAPHFPIRKQRAYSSLDKSVNEHDLFCHGRYVTVVFYHGRFVLWPCYDRNFISFFCHSALTNMKAIY